MQEGSVERKPKSFGRSSAVNDRIEMTGTKRCMNRFSLRKQYRYPCGGPSTIMTPRKVIVTAAVPASRRTLTARGISFPVHNALIPNGSQVSDESAHSTLESTVKYLKQ